MNSRISERFQPEKSWRMLGMAVFVGFMVLSVGMNILPSLSIFIAFYAGYRAYGKSVPSQGLGTGFYFLAILFGFGLQFNALVGALLFGYAAKRYAFWKHPVEAFRRPIGSSPGYYYNPKKVGAGKRLLVSIIVMFIGYRIPVFRRIIKKLIKKPLLIIAGLEIEPSELNDDDPLYYLHEDAPGQLFEDNDESETTNPDLPDVTIEND